MQAHDRHFTRGPRIGEDILAWAKEEIEAELRWVAEEGLLVVATSDEDGKPIEEPVLRMVPPDASAKDAFLEKPLHEALRTEIEGYIRGDDSFDANARERMARLRDILREHADLIDRHLAVIPENRPVPKWRKLPFASYLLSRPNVGRKALHELALHVSLRELLTGDPEELATRVQPLPYYGPKLAGLMRYEVEGWRDELRRSGEYDALVIEAEALDAVTQSSP